MNNVFENWRSFLEELVDPESIDLSSFSFKKDLCPKLWVNDRLRPEIRDRLIEIAEDFFEGLELPDVEILDIVITGSLANYNWSEFSDIDLHILINFQDVDKNTELVKKWLDEARINWNRNHDILLENHEVEIYVQDDNEEHVSSGIYSLFTEGWVVKPNREKPSVRWSEVQSKAASLMNEIDEALDLYSLNDFEEALSFAEKLKEKLRNFRKSGLESGGEFSVENIVFKTLRRNGYLEKLSNLKNDSYDKSMTLQETKNWKRVMNEAAVGADQVPNGWRLSIDEGGKQRVTIFLYNERDEVVGKIIMKNDSRLPCVKALGVEVSQAPSGYGPLLYDLAMELSGDKGIYSDRLAVSDDAAKVWKYYEFHRDDVESFHPLEFIDEFEAEEDCVEDVKFLFGEEWEDDFLSKIFKKVKNKTHVIDTLKANNKLEFSK